jgi:hypothetical protein
MSKPLSHKSRFLKYRDESVIMKSTQYAKWTLPQLMADMTLMSNGRGVVLERDYQEVGPLLVNNLAAKLTSLLFPASRPFYEAELSDAVRERATARGVDETTLVSEFAKLVLKSCKRLFRNASYAQLVQATRQLIVTGNVLVHRDSKDQRCTTYGLQSFSVRRDGRGILLDTVLREQSYIEALPPDVQRALRIASPNKYRRPDDAPPVELFTRIERKIGKTGRVYFEVTQQADELPVGTPGTYPEHLCPWQVVTWNLIAGENYGRGLVEDYAGGFAKLSDGSEAATLYGIEIMKVVHLVAPGTGADIDELAQSESGEYVQGAIGAVQAHEAGDAQKLIAMRAELQETFGNLARAFMWKANTRNAERVTAFELRLDAQEADNVLGGAYSSLSDTWQVPFAHILMHEENPATLAGILDDSIKLDIIAGVPALGRSIDLQNMLAAAQDASVIIPAFTQLSRKVDPDKLFQIVMAFSNVPTDDFLKTNAQLKAEDDATAAETEGRNQLVNAQAGAETAQAISELDQPS